MVDADEEVLDLPEYYLGTALALGFDALCETAAAAGALVVPAHVDRPMFSVSSQLGFLPPGPYAAVEAMRPVEASLSGGRTVVSGSDAHWPEHVGRRAFRAELDCGAGARGAELLGALRACLAAGRVEPSWELGAAR